MPYTPTGPNNKVNPYYEKRNHVKLAKWQASKTEFTDHPYWIPIPNYAGDLTVGNNGKVIYGYSNLNYGDLNPPTWDGHTITILVGTNNTVNGFWLEIPGNDSIPDVSQIEVEFPSLGTTIVVTWNATAVAYRGSGVVIYDQLVAALGTTIPVEFRHYPNT